MIITATEAKTNLGKYLVLSRTEDIFITKNGTIIAKLTAPAEDKDRILDELVGIVPSSTNTDKVREERRSSL